MNWLARCTLGYVALLGFSLWTAPILAQSKPAHKAVVTDALLAEPLNVCHETARVLGAKEKAATFSLVTSWIPGPSHRGYFRWQMAVVGSEVSLSEAPAFIKALHACTYTLDLYDHGGFVLRHVPIVFTRSIADSGDITQMESNDLVQMDRAEYLTFVLGIWDVKWTRPEA